MKRNDILLLVYLSLFLTLSFAKYPIEHVIVLMEENRSFDHLLGFLNRLNPEIQGLTGHEYNLNDVNKPNGPRTYVNDTSPYISPYDPDHSFESTTQKIFGSEKAGPVAKMNGFAWFEAKHYHRDPTVVLNMFPPERVPIMSTLAQEFAVFDQWFASFPGCTHPNRLYVHTGTSYGSVENNVPSGGWPQKTIYDKLNEAGRSWRMYYTDSIWAVILLQSLRKVEYKANLRPIEEFYEDCKKGNLPDYTFIEPRFNPTNTMSAEDQHPDHSILAGEILFKRLYEAIRACPQWNSSLFIITYDEHGGFYDHFPTPLDVPSPDNIINNRTGFDFKRLGIRIPTIMVSPWINKGTVVHAPKGPTPTSQYDLTSILATVKKIFNLTSFMTKRDEWAGTFEHIFTQRTSPRTDCPILLPPAPFIPQEYIKEEGQKPLNDLQKSYIAALNDMNNLPHEQGMELNQLQGGEYIRKMTERFFNK